MKRKLLLLSVLASTLLAGCGSNNDVEKKDLDPKIISQNLLEQNNLTELTYFNYTRFYEHQNVRHLQRGLGIYANDDGTYDFVNMITGRVIASKYESSSYRMFELPYINYCIQVENAYGSSVLYDSYGNFLDSTINSSDISEIYCEK